jgi:phosphoglycerate dehydrogenase-like enzyme
MSDQNFSRRVFLGTVPVGAAAAPQVITPTTNESNLAKPQGQIKIVSMTPFTDDEVKKITGASPTVGVTLVIAKTPQEFQTAIRDADVVYGQIRTKDLDFAPKLRWVQWGGAGVEGMEEGVRKHPVVVTNMARVFAPGIAETAMGLLLCLTRGITTYYMPQFYKRQMKPVGTVKSPDHIELAGRTMGIVGMGGIGSEIARRAHYGFGMRVVATDAKPIARPDFVAELHDPTWFNEMVPAVDVLVSAAPHTPATDKMFNESVFRRMKPTAYFLGMSRGNLFDDMALVKALKENWIKGAGLDVFPVEPPPSNHPIYDLPNVVMTAHTSGWGVERQTRLVALFADNVRRYAVGQPLMNVVDKRAGY